MADTEQIILKAALKIFAEKGYKGATTKSIAEESGFSEFTLFRKFKSKENLFEKVLTQGAKELNQEFRGILVDEEFSDPPEFIEHVVMCLHQVALNNFEFLNVALNGKNKVLEPIIKEFIQLLTQYLKKNLPGQEINYESLALSILAVIYLVNLEIYRGRAIFNEQAVLEGFIYNLTLSIR